MEPFFALIVVVVGFLALGIAVDRLGSRLPAQRVRQLSPNDR